MSVLKFPPQPDRMSIRQDTEEAGGRSKYTQNCNGCGTTLTFEVSSLVVGALVIACEIDRLDLATQIQGMCRGFQGMYGWVSWKGQDGLLRDLCPTCWGPLAPK